MKIKIALLTSLFAALAVLGLGYWDYSQSDEKETPERVWHHELAQGADLTLGTTTIPEDGIVDENFTSHLPLVIIDTFGEEIVNQKYNDLKTHSYVYREGVDPYTKILLQIVDNPDHTNQLKDQPIAVSAGRIKVRGNTSAMEANKKLQYLIKLDTAEAENNPISILGMEPSDTWILNGTIADRSYLRNYLALNTAGEIDPYTPDIRMCEVVRKQGEDYLYMGLYGIYEKIEQGIGRVDIPEVSNPIALSDTSYLLQRDRQEPGGYSMQVWSTKNQRSENWINLEYPSPEKITPAYWDYIRQDIGRIEDILYAEDRADFLRYPTLLDVPSFVDYFIINEAFSNYDSGWNSTFLYKNLNGKLSIGPVWDFDGAMDNYDLAMQDFRETAMQLAPWYDRLVTDSAFNKAVIDRYQELRKNILSDETISSRIKAAAAFLEHPARRDRSYYEKQNWFSLADDEEKETGLTVSRKTDSIAAEQQRTVDAILLHCEYLDQNLEQKLASYQEYEPAVSSAAGWLFITAFFVSIILVQRHRKGL